MINTGKIRQGLISWDVRDHFNKHPKKGGG